MITGKIDVTKIDKKRLFVGKQGKYLDFVLIETPNGKYGDYMIVESITKEEREAGNKGTILGNAKILNKRNPVNKTETDAYPVTAADEAWEQREAQDTSGLPW